MLNPKLKWKKWPKAKYAEFALGKKSFSSGYIMLGAAVEYDPTHYVDISNEFIYTTYFDGVIPEEPATPWLSTGTRKITSTRQIQQKQFLPANIIAAFNLSPNSDYSLSDVFSSLNPESKSDIIKWVNHFGLMVDSKVRSTQGLAYEIKLFQFVGWALSFQTSAPKQSEINKYFYDLIQFINDDLFVPASIKNSLSRQIPDKREIYFWNIAASATADNNQHPLYFVHAEKNSRSSMAILFGKYLRRLKEVNGCFVYTKYSDADLSVFLNVVFGHYFTGMTFEYAHIGRAMFNLDIKLHSLISLLYFDLLTKYVYTLSSGRVCAAPGCNRPILGKKLGAIYCSRHCAQKTAAMNYRRRQKEKK
ncbi:MAG: hypothetical protein WCV63_10250 [Negativicutes bacterium]